MENSNEYSTLHSIENEERLRNHSIGLNLILIFVSTNIKGERKRNMPLTRHRVTCFYDFNTASNVLRCVKYNIHSRVRRVKKNTTKLQCTEEKETRKGNKNEFSKAKVVL